MGLPIRRRGGFETRPSLARAQCGNGFDRPHDGGGLAMWWQPCVVALSPVCAFTRSALMMEAGCGLHIRGAPAVIGCIGEFYTTRLSFRQVGMYPCREGTFFMSTIS